MLDSSRVRPSAAFDGNGGNVRAAFETACLSAFAKEEEEEGTSSARRFSAAMLDAFDRGDIWIVLPGESDPPSAHRVDRFLDRGRE